MISKNVTVSRKNLFRNIESTINGRKKYNGISRLPEIEIPPNIEYIPKDAPAIIKPGKNIPSINAIEVAETKNSMIKYSLFKPTSNESMVVIMKAITLPIKWLRLKCTKLKVTMRQISPEKNFFPTNERFC